MSRSYKVTFKVNSTNEFKGEFVFSASNKEAMKDSVLRFANLLWYGNEGRMPTLEERELNLITISKGNFNKSIGTVHCKGVLFSPYKFEIENI